MPRPRTGQLSWSSRTNTWHGRVTLPDGSRVRRDLCTSLRAAAEARLREIAATGAGADAPKAETFAEAARRVHELRRADGVVGARDEQKRIERWAFPIFGQMQVARVEAAHVNAALDQCKADGLSRQSCVHLRQSIRAVFVQLKRESAIKVNPCDDATTPRFAETVRKERSVLTDDELAVYLGHRHPKRRFGAAVLRRQTMACVARCFGGLRTGDLHALDWSSFDSAQGGFEWGWAPRRKTRRPQLLTIPEVLRPILRDWWERAGRPSAGPIFPKLFGKTAGERVTIRFSHAKAMRQDLRRAFGVDRWDPELEHYVPARELTPRERELFEETPYTLPVDFHSWRRAFTQALAEAGVTAQTAQALAGHASLAAHARYLASSGRARALPEAAAPVLAKGLAFSPAGAYGMPMLPAASVSVSGESCQLL